jgi:ankyrin repeat protein
MSQKRQAQVPDVELQQECRQDQESTNKRARGAEGNDQQQQQYPGLDLDCKDSVNLPPPPRDDDPIITQFKPVEGQWELTEDNIKHIDPETGETILLNYSQYIMTTPLAVYRYLIETKGCDVNIQNRYKYTPLRDAFNHFNPDNELGDSIAVLRYLLSQCSVEADIENEHDSTILHTACRYVNYLPLDIFEVLIEAHGLDVNAEDSFSGYTALHDAFHRFDPEHGGDVTVLAYLVSQWDFESYCERGYTLLHTSCENINYFRLDVFKVLIEMQGFDINVKDDYDGVPLRCALQHFDPNDGGDINVLLYLLNQKNIEANIKDEEGHTILHYACENINRLPLDVFKVLIETIGCDINIQDNDENTPLHLAFDDFDPQWGGDINILAYLINQKTVVNVNTKYNNGYTLLHSACMINPSLTHSPEINAECDTIVCQIVKAIAERCLELVLDEATL